MQSIVIVGAGQAAAAAALKLRELGYAGALTLIGDEAYPPYERPELSKKYALGQAPFASLVVLDPARAAELAITLRLGETVEGIDRAGRQVLTGAGPVAYDALILATGGTARRLPLPAALRRKAHAIRTRDDADALQTRLPLVRSVAVIGGGWLGTEVAITARALCPQVDLIESAPRLCARVAPVWMSDRLAEMQAEAGVALHLGARPEFAEDGAIAIGGARLVPDLVIEAIGMRANDDLAAAAGLACDDGILVGPGGVTGDPAILAIGDCAREAAGTRLRRESWQHANLSAEDAARHLLGLPRRVPEPDWFWSTQGRHKIQMLGACPPEAEQWERRGAKGASRLFLKGARLIGCIAIDTPREIAEARRIIAAGQSLDQARACDPATPLSKCIVDARETLQLPH